VLGGVVMAARVRVVRQRRGLGGADAEREQLDDEREAGEVSARARPERSCQRWQSSGWSSPCDEHDLSTQRGAR